MVQIIVSKPLHSCEYCGLEYWKTPAYIKHLIEYHNADLPKCSFCHKQFLSNKDLHDHLEDVHTADGGNKRHKCSMCSCTFKWLRHLENHLARKHGPNAKPVLQCRYCGCEFYQRSTYTNHMLDNHWTKTVFQCNECLYRFKYKHLLVRHIQIKHGALNQWVKCKFCPASYKWARDLERHYKQKHRTLWLKMSKKDGDRNFTCSFDACFQSFESKEKFMSHYYNEHQVDLPNEKDNQQCNDTLMTKQTMNHNVDNKSCGLIIIPERFPQDIVDFECELQKVNEFRKLIDKRILGNRIEKEIHNDGDDIASPVTDAESDTVIEHTSDLQHNNMLPVNCSSHSPLITESVTNDLKVNKNLVTEKEKQYFKRNNFMKGNESDTNIQIDSDKIVLKNLKIILTRLEDDKTLNEVNLEVQSTIDTSQLNIHDFNATHVISNNLLIDINAENKIATFYSCRLCKLKFRVKESLEHHISEEHNVGVVLTSHKCKFCEAIFPFKYYLRQHLRGEHRDVLQRVRPSKHIEKCAECRLTFKSTQLYNKHMKNEHSQSNRRAVRCSSCNIMFNTRGMLNRHQKLKHNQRLYLKNKVKQREEVEHDNAPSYKCITCGIVCKDKFYLAEHMQLVHRSEQNRQNVENDLVEIFKKVEEMKLTKMKKLKTVKKCKLSRGIRKKARRTKFTMKIRPFGRSLKDLNSRFVLQNGVITSSKVKEDSPGVIAAVDYFGQTSSNQQLFACETDSNVYSQKKKLRNTNIQLSQALQGLAVKNVPKHSKCPNTKSTLKNKRHFKSHENVLPNFENNINNAKRILLAEEGSNQTTTEERKSVESARNLTKIGEAIIDEIKADSDSKNISTPIRVSSRRKSIVKYAECKQSHKLSENVITDSKNSEFVLARRKSTSFQFVDSNSQENNAADININSEEKQRNMDVLEDLITGTSSEILPESLEVCEMAFTTTEQIVLEPDGQQSQCNSKAFVKRRSQLGIEDYKCHLCNYVFQNKDCLIKHVNIHNRGYRCPMCCAVFKRKGDLTRHVKSKHDVPIYTTTPHDKLKQVYTDHSYCIKLFEKKMLAENIPPNIDLRKKQLQCNFCDKYFAFMEKLQQHIKQFHKITVTLSTCVTCNAVFNSDEDLYDHVKFVHSADDACMNVISESSQDGMKTPTKNFNWKKALAQTYKSESICGNDSYSKS